MALGSNWIDKIRVKYRLDGVSGDQVYNYNIGTTFENVIFSNNNSYSLKDFFNKVQTYFKAQSHTQYGGTDPITFKPIIEWYEFN